MDCQTINNLAKGSMSQLLDKYPSKVMWTFKVVGTTESHQDTVEVPDISRTTERWFYETAAKIAGVPLERFQNVPSAKLMTCAWEYPVEQRNGTYVYK